MRHPDLDYVQRTVEPLLGEHRLEDCKLEGCIFDAFSSTYQLVVSKAGQDIKLKIPSEIFDGVQDGRDPFAARKIKGILKTALGGK